MNKHTYAAAIAAVTVSTFFLASCDAPGNNDAVHPKERYTVIPSGTQTLFVVDQEIGFVYRCDAMNFEKANPVDTCSLIGSVNFNYHDDARKKMWHPVSPATPSP